MTCMPHSARRQGGFTLVEILVTVVLISVGLLGIAALQVTTLRGNQEAYVRSQASVLSADILDRMRANADAARNNLYNADWNGTGTAATRAGQDLADWQQTINNILPGGADVAAGRVERNAVTRVVTITIRWQERSTGDSGVANGGPRTFVTRSEI